MPGTARHVLRRCATPVTAVLAALTMVTGTAAAAFALNGVDVSHWQQGTSSSAISWSAAKHDGVTFAFIKATEGTSFTDPRLAYNWAETTRLGIYRGAYHFARPSSGSAAAQARYFVSKAGTAGARGDLPPVLDLESSGGLGPSALRTWTANWLSTVKTLTGRTPIIYCSPAFWEDNLGNSTAFTRYPLWIAHYTTGAPRVPGGWSTWTFWQSTSSGSIDGIAGNVDIDHFYGTSAQLAALANNGSSTPPPVTTTATTTTLSASTTAATQGDSVTFTGNLVDAAKTPLAGQSVGLFRQDPGSTTWTKLPAVATTDVSGNYTMASTADGSASYRATFAGDNTRAASSSPVVTVTVTTPVTAPDPVTVPAPTPVAKTATRVRLGSMHATVRRGHAVKLYGHLTTAAGSAMAGRRVYIYRQPSGSHRWHFVKSVPSIAPTGWYQAYVKPWRTNTYKAVFRGATRYGSDTSNLVRIRTHR